MEKHSLELQKVATEITSFYMHVNAIYFFSPLK